MSWYRTEEGDGQEMCKQTTLVWSSPLCPDIPASSQAFKEQNKNNTCGLSERDTIPVFRSLLKECGVFESIKQQRPHFSSCISAAVIRVCFSCLALYVMLNIVYFIYSISSMRKRYSPGAFEKIYLGPMHTAVWPRSNT